MDEIEIEYVAIIEALVKRLRTVHKDDDSLVAIVKDAGTVIDVDLFDLLHDLEAELGWI